MASLNLALAFLIELCMLAIFAFWGYQTGGSLPVKLALGFGVPLLVIYIWSIFLAPASARRLSGLPFYLLKNFLFALAVIALIAIGKSVWALIFALVAAVNQILLLTLRQET